MIMMHLQLILIISCVLLVSSSGDKWKYTGLHGQDEWTQISQECSGSSQSPINIDTRKVKVDPSLAITFQGYSKPIEGRNFKLTNNGHSVQLSLEPGRVAPNDIPLIKGPALNGMAYKFAQLHFHWHSQLDSEGSEHAIDGRRFALEMHYVHWNEKYGDIGEAINHKDGLAVIGTLFQVTRKNNSFLDPLVSALGRVRDESTSTSLAGSIILDQILPNNIDEFYRYSGSLTTPPCSESVTWIVFREVTGVSQSQMSYYRSLMTHDDHHQRVQILHNVRNLQELRKRDIVASWMQPVTGEGTRLLSPLSNILSSLLIVKALHFLLVTLQ